MGNNSIPRIRKTIAFISLYTEMGGAEYSLFFLLKSLDRDTYRPILVVNSDGPLVHKVKSLGIEVFEIPFTVVMLKQILKPRVFSNNLRASRSLTKLLHEQHVDIIQCSDVLALWLLLPALLVKARPVVYSVTFFHERLRAWMLNLIALPFVSKLVFNSKSVRDDLLRRTNGLPKRSIVAYNGVETRQFYPRTGDEKAALRKKLSLPSDKIVIGFIGRYELWKGHETFLDAALQLRAKRDDLLFLIVGGAMTENVIPEISRYRQAVLQKAAAFAQRGDLIIMDNRDDIPEIMACLDIFVCPSDLEPYGLVVLEAYASGIPVVASSTVGALEIFSGDERIFVAEPNNAGSFVQKIEKAIQFNEHAIHMPQVPSALARYTWAAYAREFEEIYEEL
jgi:glycosyltransferase involved in cell wall biosynthesis